MDFWSERHPIPKRMVFEVTEEGAIGPEQRDKRETREAIVREVEVGVVMGLEEAIAFRDWLDTKIEQATRLKAGKTPNAGDAEAGSNGKPKRRREEETFPLAGASGYSDVFRVRAECFREETFPLAGASGYCWETPDVPFSTMCGMTRPVAIPTLPQRPVRESRLATETAPEMTGVQGAISRSGGPVSVT
jgi:hypothetical protein